MTGNENGSKPGHTVLLGGIGGDSHSVGLTILRQALTMNGYNVHYLGTQNTLNDFFEMGGLCNAVMISSMDGHTRYYLRGFAELMRQYKMQNVLWYLGGNLHIGNGDGLEDYFMKLGFNRVFVKFVDINRVLGYLKRDLAGIPPIGDYPALRDRASSFHQVIPTPVSDEPVEHNMFKSARREVLKYWRTGSEAKNMCENAEFLRRQASFPKAQQMVNLGSLPVLIQPRSGVPSVDEQIALFRSFKRAGAKVLSYQVDSLTRNNNYVDAELAIRESTASGKSTLNGFPVINHGVTNLRRIISEVAVPLQTRHSTRDPRLLAEISYAGGVTAFEGGSICYNIPYYKNYPLDQSIKTWQYVDYLTGLYFKRFGIVLDREFFGTLTATLIPPSLAIVTGIIEGLLAVRQGVKCISLGYAEQGNRAQDIAAIRVLEQLGREVIYNLGYKDVQLNTVFHQYMAAFPESQASAEELIYNSAVTGKLSGATRIIAKTPVESFKIPTQEDNLQGLRLVNRGVLEAHGKPIDEEKITAECSIIRREAQAILDSVIYCGGGDLAEGVIKGFRKGYLDIPFSPSIYNKGEMMTARDSEGAVRFLSTGNLQLDRETKEFHEYKMAERRRDEGIFSAKEDYLLVERDVMRIPRGQYERWPLCG